jgi:hypothetical protein
MVVSEQYKECEEPEISQLKELLSKVGGEHLAYLRGASKALLYVQELQGLTDAGSFTFEDQGGE